LADQGFDLWLGNNRGNVYSRKHLYLSPQYDEFWSFSYDEFAAFDLPNSVEYILNLTNSKNLAYIGHSEGTTQAFALLSDNPSFSENLNYFIGLGPVATVSHMECAVFLDLAAIHFDDILEFFGLRKAFLPPPQNGFIKRSIAWIIDIFPFLSNDVIKILCGKSQDTKHALIKRSLPNFGENEPGGTSMQNVCHWTQVVRAKRFQKYDYGKAENFRRYQAFQPPGYDVSLIPTTLPKALFYGSNDTLADPQDVAHLISMLGNGVYSKELKNYDHVDYLWDIDATTTLYPEIIRLLKDQ